MSVANRRRQRWDTRPYRWIASAELDGPNLCVGFEDGDRVRVDVTRLLPPGADVSAASDLAFTAHDVSIPSSEGAIDVSWVSIRLLTDPAFDAHWAAIAAEEDRLIGDRIAALRVGQGLTTRELARRAEVPHETMTRVETGQTRAGFALLERILVSLGATLDDLAVEPESTATPAGAQGAPTPT